MNAERATTLKQAWRWGAVLALGLAYAVLSHLAASAAAPDLLDASVAVVPLLALALAMAWRTDHRLPMLALWLAACAALYAVSPWLVAHFNWIFLLQHAGIHALLCGAFGRTLLPGRVPMVSGFARIVHGELSSALLTYTRSATWAWTGYFGATCALSLTLFWLAPVAVWSMFANLLGGALLVLMFAGEYAVRCFVLPPAERAGPLDAIRAYRQASGERAVRRP